MNEYVYRVGQTREIITGCGKLVHILLINWLSPFSIKGFSRNSSKKGDQLKKRSKTAPRKILQSYFSVYDTTLHVPPIHRRASLGCAGQNVVGWLINGTRKGWGGVESLQKRLQTHAYAVKPRHAATAVELTLNCSLFVDTKITKKEQKKRREKQTFARAHPSAKALMWTKC